MHKVFQYIFKREYKFFVFSLIGYILLLISLRYLNLEKEVIGGFRALMMSRFVILILALIFIERLSIYIPKGIHYKESEYMLYIPHKNSTVINAIIILMILGILIFHSVNYLFLRTTYEELILALVTILSLTILSNFLMQIFSLLIKKKIMVSIAVLVLGSSLFVSISKIGNSMSDYFNNFDLTIISSMIMLFALGYFGLCRCLRSKNEASYDYKVIATSIVLVSIGIYMSGQYL